MAVKILFCVAEAFKSIEMEQTVDFSLLCANISRWTSVKGMKYKGSNEVDKECVKLCKLGCIKGASRFELDMLLASKLIINRQFN